MTRINNQYNLFQIVYQKTDPQQLLHTIISIRIDPGNSIMYLLREGDESYWYYEDEISADKDMLMVVK